MVRREETKMTNEEITEEIKSIQAVRDDLKLRIEVMQKIIDEKTFELRRMRAEDTGWQLQQLNLRDSLKTIGGSVNK
jgi:hypothetical protein